MKKSLLLISLLSLAGAASAGDLFQHPAVFSPRSLPAVDANTFIVAHPAHGFVGTAQPDTAQAKSQGSTAPRAERAEEVAQATTRAAASSTRQQ